MGIAYWWACRSCVSFATKMNAKFKEVDKRMDELTTKVDENAEELEQAQQKVEKVEKNVGHVEKKVDDMERGETERKTIYRWKQKRRTN